MRYEWRFDHLDAENVHTMAAGDDSAHVLALVFLRWMDKRPLGELESPGRLAGFLVAYSNLSRREVAGLLGTLKRASVPDGYDLTFELGGDRVRVHRETNPTQSIAGT